MNLRAFWYYGLTVVALTVIFTYGPLGLQTFFRFLP